MFKRLLFATMALLIIILGISVAQAEVTSQSMPDVGAVFILGRYEQNNNNDDGLEPIEWQVLDIQGNKALLISRHALDCLPYNDAKEPISWKGSSLRAWLNKDFLEAAFTEAEHTILLTSSVPNDAEENNAEWTSTADEDTEDCVFLLSCHELNALCPEKKDRKISGTEYARKQGAKFLGITSVGIGETDWWLRSPGEKPGEAAYVNVRGAVSSRKVSDEAGIRPAIWVDWTADRSLFPDSLYKQAILLQNGNRFEKAADIFEALGNYKDSSDMAKKCRYQQALSCVASGDDNTAFDLFQALDGYSDSYLQARSCLYRMAVALQDAGDYARAIELFSEVGQYEDSMNRLRQCYDQCGISIYYFSPEAVNAGFDCGYSKASPIDGKDKHFGWRLGRFFMSGFTRVSNEESKNPLFIKTLGDTLTLWFDLEQDIDCLNGNRKLSIAEDENGYDESFGVQKTNFGRGTLIVRHTDYQNAQSDPVIYTDYLLAKGTSGADTKVVLQEEGDYEVALDYELQDDEITHITSKYENYRILLKFSIRNGNCMVYPFDVLTGIELQNTSVTEKGFSLDLARSRYLDINVKRSVLVEGASGIVEDERFNRPAKDGDQYTQEGIYTISVSNRYTGESTTKTLFVGSDELLAEYIANGFSPDSLS